MKIKNTTLHEQFHNQISKSSKINAASIIRAREYMTVQLYGLAQTLQYRIAG